MKRPELPFTLSDLKNGLTRIFSYSRREVVISVLIVAAVLVVVLIITIISLVSTGRATVRMEKELSPEVNEEAAASLAERPFLSDFIIYGDILEESFAGVVYSREPQERWSEEMVDQYWIDPREIVADQLEKDAEKMIRDIFADVP